MISATNNFKELTAKDYRTYKMYIVDNVGNEETVNKSSLTLPFCSNNLTFGAVSSAQVDLEITDSKLTKNQIITLYIKHTKLDEPVRLGVFRITENKKKQGLETNKVFKIVAYDKINFIKQKIYSSTGKKTISAIWSDLCSKSESTGFDSSFATYSGSFKDTEIDSSLLSGYNIRDAMSYLASLIGANVIVNSAGGYALRHFIVYSDYSLLNYNRIATPTLDETDTNIKYLVAKKSNEETISVGETTGDGIVLTNPIAIESVLNSALTEIKSTIGSYRVGNINYMLADPLIKCGDVIPLIGIDNTEICKIPVMEIKYKFDGGLSCTIYSNKPNENESLTMAEKLSFSVKDSTDSRKYAQAAIDFSKAMSNGLGMHVTTRTDSTGATIYYLHDQKDLEKSEKVWKITSEGIGFATSWNGDFITGVNEQGNIITNMLTAYKINADMIDAGAITSDKIEAGAVTSDKIYVEDLYTLNATIADWSIHNNLLYVPSEKQNDGTYNYSVGLSPTSTAFYAGYLSNKEIYNKDASHPGSPYEKTGLFDDTSVNIYIKRSGQLVVQNQGTITSISKDKNGKIIGKVEIQNGGFECFSKPTNSDNLFKYGLVKADINENISTTIPAMCIQSDYTNSSGIVLSANKNAWQAIYNNEQQLTYNNGQQEKIFSFWNTFYGSVRFQSSIWADGSVTSPWFYATHETAEKGVSRYTAFRITSNGTLQIGSTSQPGNTQIYAYKDENDSKYDKAVVSMNDFWINESRGIYFSDGTNYNRVFYYGTVSNLTGFHIGMDSQKNYFYGGGIYEGISGSALLTVSNKGELVLGERTRSKVDLVADTIRCRGDFLLTSGYELQLYINDGTNKGPYTCLKYDTIEVDNSPRKGIHFGVQTQGLDLWYDGDALFHGDISVLGDVFSSDHLISNYAIVYGSIHTKVLSISTYDTGEYYEVVGFLKNDDFQIGSPSLPKRLRLVSGSEVYCLNNFQIAQGKSIQISNGSSWYKAFYYGTESGKKGLHIGAIISATENSMYLWGTVKLSSGGTVTSDANQKNSIETVSENYEKMFYELKPVTYKYNDGTSGRKHLGFIAQDVKNAINKSDLTTKDVAAYVSDLCEDGTELLSLRYSEFVALNTHMIQKCLAKISSLEDEIKLLKKETINNG